MSLDFDHCYRAVQSRDARFDGWFFTAVRTTGIYCRPSCPAVTPKAGNVSFYPTAAAAQLAGFRACRRCRPDASPGSPEWNSRADLVGRAMRLIADGVVDREGVAGLARRLGYSERHLHRQLLAEVGAGPIALARAQRAHTARLLLETTELPVTATAFAAGFASVRQFNDTIREVFAATPTMLRQGRRAGGRAAAGTVTLRLTYRSPFDGAALLDFLGRRGVPAVEDIDGSTYRRSLRLPHGTGVVELSPDDGHVRCTLRLSDLRDLGVAAQRCRALLDLDSDPVAVEAALRRDPLIGAAVRRHPGLRIPGTVDGFELAVRALLGQQVSVSGARTLAGRLVKAGGEALASPVGGITHLFPAPEAVAEIAPTAAMPQARRSALGHLARAGIDLDPGADRAGTEAALVALPGIGPWTTGYVAMRALRDPDVFLPTDLGVRRALEGLGHPATPRDAAAVAERWRPWRSYALQYLWSTLSGEAAL